ncbi:Dbl domain-containing protein [Salix suchowensis]|nr:Dbl domain-containing protein [Salix suchowensis]
MASSFIDSGVEGTETPSSFPEGPLPRKRTSSLSSLDGAVRSLRNKTGLKPKDAYPFPVEPLKEQRSPHRLAFMDYMIKPVQRICKYPLLLDQLQTGKHVAALASRKSSVQVVVRAPPRQCDMWPVLSTRHAIARIRGKLRTKYLGAMLYLGGYFLLVKVGKNKIYDPKHWMSLAEFDIIDVREDEGHQFELAASCYREKEVWLNAIKESLSEFSKWLDEPTASIHCDGKLVGMLRFFGKNAFVKNEVFGAQETGEEAALDIDFGPHNTKFCTLFVDAKSYPHQEPAIVKLAIGCQQPFRTSNTAASFHVSVPTPLSDVEPDDEDNAMKTITPGLFKRWLKALLITAEHKVPQKKTTPLIAKLPNYSIAISATSNLHYHQKPFFNPGLRSPCHDQ